MLAVDARPSDSIALALRAKSPIYVSEKLFDGGSGEKWRPSLRHLTDEEQAEAPALPRACRGLWQVPALIPWSCPTAVASRTSRGRRSWPRAPRSSATSGGGFRRLVSHYGARGRELDPDRQPHQSARWVRGARRQRPFPHPDRGRSDGGASGDLARVHGRRAGPDRDGGGAPERGGGGSGGAGGGRRRGARGDAHPARIPGGGRPGGDPTDARCHRHR
jgi:hypothetical protein